MRREFINGSNQNYIDVVQTLSPFFLEKNICPFQKEYKVLRYSQFDEDHRHSIEAAFSSLRLAFSFYPLYAVYE
jgi:hypothetical protein